MQGSFDHQAMMQESRDTKQTPQGRTRSSNADEVSEMNSSEFDALDGGSDQRFTGGMSAESGCFLFHSPQASSSASL